MRARFFQELPRSARALCAVGALLVVGWAIAFAIVWRALPADSVKLHGNIDTGVDLLGTRSDLLWVAAAAVIVVGVNSGLAAWLRYREPVAAFFLLAAVPVLLFGLFGSLAFISHLNTPR